VSVGKGSLVLLSELNIEIDDFIDYDSEDEDDISDAGKMFGKKLIGLLVGIDKALQSGRAVTPPPGWTEQSEYTLSEELVLRSDIGRG
jgi:hypothetical protein